MSPFVRGVRCRVPLGLAAALSIGLLAGCPAPPPPRTAATVKAEELPADPAELLKRLDELSQTHERVQLENALVVADKLLSMKPGDFDASWRAARAAFWLADEAEGDKGRRAYWAGRGVAYADEAVRANDKAIEGIYYRALSRGYLAQTKTMSALDLVGEVAKDAKTAIAIDEKYDGAGPLRLYGTLLLKAPGWPTSIGDPEEAMEVLAKAVQVAPEHPLNHLYYGEALMANDKPAEAKKEFSEAMRLSQGPEWAYARARLTREAQQQITRADAKLK